MSQELQLTIEELQNHLHVQYGITQKTVEEFFKNHVLRLKKYFAIQGHIKEWVIDTPPRNERATFTLR